MPRILASWFGTGLIVRRIRGNDGGSGTVASVFTFPVSVAVGLAWGWPAQVLLFGAVVAAGFWALNQLESEGDAGWIVVDEAAGMVLATIGLAWGAAVVAFVVFRLADIAKRVFPGVRQAEELSGATGIIADDLVAGLYGLVAGLVFSALM